jgi:hypothetical protein
MPGAANCGPGIFHSRDPDLSFQHVFDHIVLYSGSPEPMPAKSGPYGEPHAIT